MLIPFFKSSFFSQYLAIFLIGLILWMGGFIHATPMPPPEGPVPVYALLYHWLKSYPLISSLSAFLLNITAGFSFIAILNRHELIQKNSSLSGLVLVVFVSLHPLFLSLNPVSLSLWIFLFILHHLLIYYNKPEHLDRVFTIGFSACITALIYLPGLLTLLYIFIGLILCRASSWRAWFAALIGFITPLIYLVAYGFFFDNLRAISDEYIHFFQSVRISVPHLSPDFLFIAGAGTLYILWAIIKPMREIDRAVEFRAKTNIIFWSAPFFLGSIPITGSILPYHLLLIAPVASLIIARTLLGMKKIRVAETLFIVYILIILSNNLFHPFVNSM